MSSPTVLIVPGLRDAVAQHWQTLLEARLRERGRRVVSVPPLGREDLDCAARVDAIDRVARALNGPIVVVAHSGGCVMLVHWAHGAHRAQASAAADPTPRQVRGALLATPPDFDSPLPEGYPTLEALHAGGWLPVPRVRLPFPSIVAASSNDPLARFERAAGLAHDWGSRLVDLGPVGHLNPASGHGPWPRAESFIDELSGATAAAH